MPKYTCDPNAEIIGHALMATVNHINRDSVEPFLVRFGLHSIEPEVWYPVPQWIALLNAIEEEGGGMMDFVSLGLAIAGTAYIPPEAENLTFEEFCQGMDYAYQMNHRGGDVGHYCAEVVEAGHVVVTVTAPYPDDQSYGVMYGFARRYLPAGTRFLVTFDEDIPRRDFGGTETVIHIEW